MPQNETAMDASKVKGIIFDYGGTIDTAGDHWSEVIWDAYSEAGVAVDKPTFRVAYVEAERELARTRHILPEHDFRDVMLVKMRLELQYLAEHGHFPAAQVEPVAEKLAEICYQKAKSQTAQAAVVLKDLSKRYRMVLVSNFYGNIETVLKDFELDGFFPNVVESAKVGVRKPNPDIFKLGVEKLGLMPDEVLVVGDSYSKDIVPARRLGCQTVMITGRGWDEEVKVPSDVETISDLAQLPSLL